MHVRMYVHTFQMGATTACGHSYVQQQKGTMQLRTYVCRVAYTLLIIMHRGQCFDPASPGARVALKSPHTNNM